jgi:hypothetical protein
VPPALTTRSAAATRFAPSKASRGATRFSDDAKRADQLVALRVAAREQYDLDAGRASRRASNCEQLVLETMIERLARGRPDDDQRVSRQVNAETLPQQFGEARVGREVREVNVLLDAS